MSEATEVLTLAEAAAHVRMSEDYVRKQCLSGALPAKKFGNRWRITRAALDEFVADGKPTARSRNPQLTARQQKAAKR